MKASQQNAPSKSILHSFLNFLESSSICLSISAERAWASLSWVDMQLPMVARAYGRSESVECVVVVDAVGGCGNKQRWWEDVKGGSGHRLEQRMTGTGGRKDDGANEEEGVRGGVRVVDDVFERKESGVFSPTLSLSLYQLSDEHIQSTTGLTVTVTVTVTQLQYKVLVQVNSLSSSLVLYKAAARIAPISPGAPRGWLQYNLFNLALHQERRNALHVSSYSHIPRSRSPA